MTSADRSIMVARQITRALGVLAAIGLCVLALGVVQSSDLFRYGALALAFALVAVVTLPAGLALGTGLRWPAALADHLRVEALLIGAIGAGLGMIVSRAHTALSGPVGVVLVVTGLLAVSVAFRPPRPARWRPSSDRIAYAGFLLILLFILPKFEGPKPRAYYLGMQRATAEIAQWQDAVRTDSGHFAAQLDTSQLYETASFLRASGSLAFSATADGYRVSATSGLAPGRCAVYVGGAPEPPATQTGVAACTPYPEDSTASLGTLWLACVVLVALIGFVTLRPLPDLSLRS